MVNLKLLPKINRKLLRNRKYITTDTLQATRGCVHHCEFCSVAPFNRYQIRTRPIKSVIDEYQPDYKCKIVLPSVIDDDKYRIFSVIVQSPQGKQIKARLTPKAYLGIVAASNFKQRVRKMLESDPIYLERIARTRFHMSRPNETIYLYRGL